jgi:hypothetical protein
LVASTGVPTSALSGAVAEIATVDVKVYTALLLPAPNVLEIHFLEVVQQTPLSSAAVAAAVAVTN